MSADFSNLAIIIPAYNEEQSIEAVIVTLSKTFPSADLLVVDDGSTDATAERANHANVRVISHHTRLGYGAALKTGIRNVSQEFVLTYDGDGQHNPESALSVVEPREQFDVVIGARDRNSHRAWDRRPGKFVLRHFANLIGGTKIPDVNSGLRVFRRQIILKYLHLMPSGFSFSTTSTLALMKGTWRVKFVPIHTTQRIGSSSVRQIPDGLSTILLIIRLAVLFEPLRVFLFVSGGLGLLSLVSFAIDLINPDSGVADTTVLLTVSTVVVFMSGLVCDQVSAMRREKHE